MILPKGYYPNLKFWAFAEMSLNKIIFFVPDWAYLILLSLQTAQIQLPFFYPSELTPSNYWSTGSTFFACYHTPLERKNTENVGFKPGTSFSASNHSNILTIAPSAWRIYDRLSLSKEQLFDEKCLSVSNFGHPMINRFRFLPGSSPCSPSARRAASASWTTRSTSAPSVRSISIAKLQPRSIAESLSASAASSWTGWPWSLV